MRDLLFGSRNTPHHRSLISSLYKSTPLTVTLLCLGTGHYERENYEKNHLNFFMIATLLSGISYAENTARLEETITAAEQGETWAQLSLGLMYTEGDGTPQNYKEAKYWLTGSAEQRNTWAQFSLGLMYANGHGIPQDNKRAYAWFNLIVPSNDIVLKENAKKARSDSASQLTPQELAEAQALSEEYYQKYLAPLQ